MPCRANHSALAATRSVSVRSDSGVHAAIPSNVLADVYESLVGAMAAK